jgi:hypothetical protein
MSGAKEVLARLEKSDFRRGFHLNAGDRNYLERKGIALLLDHARDFIEKRLAPAEPPKDGKQTPWRGHPVFVAQHGTATCCRGCLEKWHAIPKGREMTEQEKDYAVEVIGAWLSRERNRESLSQGSQSETPDLFGAAS